ncbi:aminotransferase class V-fold PLP-dependent enzyme [Actinophytocola sp. S1-96]|uniref:Aminotransferase class V-fold PLP-dependent enzyme n=1 Tax=Actinophytocola gossypii TaxID=2812003 RepID=A0ABT2J1Z6_9PSEU|nr:aminotransferase class V-fold PLP-dependent enzyme [Actinophytocola gossypii]
MGDVWREQFDEAPGYLDFARVGPPSRAVLEESAALLGRMASAGPSTVDDLTTQDLRARRAVARLCGAADDRVALLPHTSQGLFQAAFAVPAGEVLVSAAEFPANTYPWVRAEQAGRLTVRRLRPPRGRMTPEAVAAALTEDTTVVSVSAVDFRTGYRADLAALREVVGDRLLVVDGIQGVGVVDEPWAVADVLVCGGQKWLRAGWGTGFAVLSDRALNRMNPLLSGWTGVRDPAVFDDEVHEPAPGARSWSVTNLSLVNAGALARALELVEELGPAVVSRRIADRVAELDDVLRSAGAEIVSATDRRAGILSFRLPGHPVEDVAAALARVDIAATVRPDQVRLSPHASTGPTAVDLVRTALADLRRDTRTA